MLLTDDGVGVHAARQLLRQNWPGVTVVEIGTAVLHGLSFVESAGRVLLIDAARGGRLPGTIYLFDPHDSGAETPMHSLHSLGLRQAWRALVPDRPPPPFTVIGVEPASLDYGMSLSPAVQAALPQVLALARQTVLAWQAGLCRSG